MKNSIKTISLALGVCLASVAVSATSNAQGLPALNEQAAPFYVPLTLSGSASVGITTVTNGTNQVFSKKSTVVNNAGILSEIYASDDLRGVGFSRLSAIAPAVGDNLFIVIKRPYTNYTPNVYAVLPNGQRVVVTNEQYYYQIDPWTGSYVQSGDVVILDARGKVKADLSKVSVQNYFEQGLVNYSIDNVWDYTSTKPGSISVGNYLIHFKLEIVLDFASHYGDGYWQYRDDEYMVFQTWGGGTWTTSPKQQSVGGAMFSGSVASYMTNPDSLVATSEGVACDQRWIGPGTVSTSSWFYYWWQNR